ncbi:MAG: hypothetical protein PHV11_03875 [Candidatus Bipolaricaulis sp.]|nr:hypothetical protein [Candidatus Bipolaricaulis sp.]
MSARGGKSFSVFVAAAILAIAPALPVHASSFRSVGLRVIVPLGNVPFMIGVEAAADVSFGVASATFFLSSGGGTVISLSGDIPLSDDPGAAKAFFRFTAGISYFDAAQPYPIPFVGAGLAYDARILGSSMVSIAGEFLYPLSFPTPLLTLAGRWSP